MRPKLFRAAISRLVLRIAALVVLVVAGFAPSTTAALGLAAAAVAVWVVSTVITGPRPTRARVTAPRALRAGA